MNDQIPYFAQTKFGKLGKIGCGTMTVFALGTMTVFKLGTMTV
jgi:hypothetical protein